MFLILKDSLSGESLWIFQYTKNLNVNQYYIILVAENLKYDKARYHVVYRESPEDIIGFLR